MSGLGQKCEKARAMQRVVVARPNRMWEVQGEWTLYHCFSKFTQDIAKGLEGTTEQVVISCDE
jgi:hypothetical protein